MLTDSQTLSSIQLGGNKNLSNEVIAAIENQISPKTGDKSPISKDV